MNIKGALFGGIVGDALGVPVEFNDDVFKELTAYCKRNRIRNPDVMCHG